MIELEIMLKDLNKMLEKEKGLRNKVLLENAISSIKEYEMAISTQQEAVLLSRRKK